MIRDAFIANGDNAEFAFGQKGDQSTYSDSGKSHKKSGIKESIKGVVKSWPWLYQTIVISKYLKDQEKLFQSLAEGKKYDLIVEFHTTGSTIGARLAKKWGAKFSAIFDSPTDEQFLEMYGTKSAKWSDIVAAEKETMESADRIK